MIKKWYQKKVSKPIAATMEEWAEWTDATKKNHPVLYYVFDRFPLFLSIRKKRVEDFIYHTKQKYGGKGYHILKLDVVRFKEPYNENKLRKYSWFDADSQIDLFMFQILVNFVEKEVGLEHFKEVAYDEERNQTSDYYKQLFELYYWFVDDYCNNSYERKLKSELYARFPDRKTLEKSDIFAKAKTEREAEYEQATTEMYDKIRKHDNAKSKEMTENLIKLVKLRGAMWT